MIPYRNIRRSKHNLFPWISVYNQNQLSHGIGRFPSQPCRNNDLKRFQGEPGDLLHVQCDEELSAHYFDNFLNAPIKE